MSEVKKIATRESYGNALAQNLITSLYWMQTLRLPQRPVFSKRLSRNAILTVVSLSVT